VFRDRVDETLSRLDLKLSAIELKLMLRTVSWGVESAPPVLAKVCKPGKVEADRMSTRISSSVRNGFGW
jgi:type I restriction enzyme M protein